MLSLTSNSNFVNIYKAFLFLDIDGVLHPNDAESKEMLSKMFLFVELMNKMNNVGVVISSSWRYHYKIKNLKKIFPKEIRELIIDTTPIIKKFSNSDRSSEINLWLKKNNAINHPYIILDDTLDWFSDYKNLIIINGRDGLTKNDLEKIIKWYNNL